MNLITKNRVAVLGVFLVGSMVATRVEAQRVTSGLVVGYDFSEGSGTTVGDSSGNGVALDLTIHDPSAVTWGAGFITLDTSTIISSASAANVAPESTAGKVSTAIIASNALTLEAWVRPSQIDGNAGPGRIVGMSPDSGFRNFTLGQNQAVWATRLRTTGAGLNGTTQQTQTTDPISLVLQHVVYTRDAAGAAEFYVDGVLQTLDTTGAFTDTITGDTSAWDATYDFGLGNELTWTDIAQRDWLGDLYLVAVYDRALSQGDVTANFAAGALAVIVPEPGSLVLLALGMAATVVGRRRR